MGKSADFFPRDRPISDTDIFRNALALIKLTCILAPSHLLEPFDYCLSHKHLMQLGTRKGSISHLSKMKNPTRTKTQIGKVLFRVCNLFLLTTKLNQDHGFASRNYATMMRSATSFPRDYSTSTLLDQERNNHCSLFRYLCLARQEQIDYSRKTV